MLETIDFNTSERARGVKYAIGSINWTMFGTGYDYQMSLERLVQGMKEHGLGELSPHFLHGSSTPASPPPPHTHTLKLVGDRSFSMYMYMYNVYHTHLVIMS